MIYSPSNQDSIMFDTLTFSKKMQKSGMSELIADELACSFRDLNINHFDSLLTKNQFEKFEKEMQSEIEEIHKEIDNLVTKTEFQKFEKEIRGEIEEIHKEIEEIHKELDNLVTKTEFQKFEKEIRGEIEEIHEEISEIRIEFKQEIEKMVTKDEFNNKIKNLELNITIKMGLIMTTGIGVLGLLIKL